MTSESPLLQQLPSVHEALRHSSVAALIQHYPRQLVVEALQGELEVLRGEIRTGLLSEASLKQRLSGLERRLARLLEVRLSPSLCPVINASGVILHTNAGRAPLARQAARAVARVATGYSNLEYDLESGERGLRDQHFERRFCRLLNSEAATVCNNNAAAVFLILNTLAMGKKVLVSRGELIEIGGSFRIPAIMERSGAILKEVGTTNKTRISDYREALDEATALILRVHPSNYKIIGFTDRPPRSELVELARRSRIPLVEDLGSGLLFPSSLSCLRDEPSARLSLSQGVDLLCFSGDKLLGGPQAGVIVGKRALVERVRRNPLMRACRVDKMTYAALEWTLLQYEQGIYQEGLPVHRMLAATADEIRRRAEAIQGRVASSRFQVELREAHSVIGGGSAPEEHLPTWVLAVRSTAHTASELQRRLRTFTPPILARIEADRLMLDLRTVFPDQEKVIVSAFAALEERKEPARNQPDGGGD